MPMTQDQIARSRDILLEKRAALAALPGRSAAAATLICGVPEKSKIFWGGHVSSTTSTEVTMTLAIPSGSRTFQPRRISMS